MNAKNFSSFSGIRLGACVAAVVVWLVSPGGALAAPLPPLPEASRKFDKDGGLEAMQQAYGRLLERKDADALEQAKQRIAKSDPYALFILAQYIAGTYPWALSSDKTLDMAAPLFAQAGPELKTFATEGEPFAQLLYGRALKEGWGVEPDVAAAVDWYRKAAEQGYALAQRTYGTALAQGDGVTQDYKAAVELFRKAGEQGDVDSQVLYAQALENGVGVAKDDKAATEWYRKAAALGNRSAKFTLLEQSGDLDKAFQANFDRFPLLATEQNVLGLPAWRTLTMNKDPLVLDGLRFDGFRFAYTGAEGEDFLWSAALPENAEMWYIVAEKGRMEGAFKTFYHDPMPSGALIRQGSLASNFQPGRTYLIWFRFNDEIPSPVSVAYTFRKPPADGPDPFDKSRMVEIFGTPGERMPGAK